MSDTKPAARPAQSQMAAEAARAKVPSVVIGAETSGPGEAADILADLHRTGGWPAHVGWAYEITRGTDLVRATARAGSGGDDRPAVISWNLLSLSDGGGGWLRLFVGTVPADMERTLAAVSGSVVVWTAADEAQFASSLAILDRLQPRRTDVAIMTPFVHRLAFHLATRP
jgi:hypothetical protein